MEEGGTAVDMTSGRVSGIEVAQLPRWFNGMADEKIQIGVSINEMKLPKLKGCDGSSQQQTLHFPVTGLVLQMELNTIPHQIRKN